MRFRLPLAFTECVKACGELRFLFKFKVIVAFVVYNTPQVLQVICVLTKHGLMVIYLTLKWIQTSWCHLEELPSATPIIQIVTGVLRVQERIGKTLLLEVSQTRKKTLCICFLGFHAHMKQAKMISACIAEMFFFVFLGSHKAKKHFCFKCAMCMHIHHFIRKTVFICNFSD